MKNEKILNFFYEDEKFYNKEIDKEKLILISIIVFTIVINLNKFYKTQKLEENVTERKSVLNCIEQNKETSNIKQTTSKLSSILNLMDASELKSVEMKNKKLKLKGETNDFEKIKNYLDIVKEIENTKEANIDFINNNENIYEFEISSF
ncbi:hypothetical protein ANS017_00470 [Paraclostridium bifermentans]|uniref:hypothetical protein n=1 Tax=Paraclostridium TaxID=1849822 RepID=UPI001CC63B1A|nr:MULTISPECIES: hypothetical protein [Paraclostridium]MBZ6005439.1 hypothetical protein [Paraclostridium bifermentans]MCR1876503.1 hypothetical protein [Paraclostridium bifermentans]MDU0296554.1 hypothetical protein [Paraclostridium sp. MRS3W1]GKZ02415.1 hypothetical protein ANS014_08490 [Paraclostridium bifermentans]GKZ05866.1 hypothetical protein ANS015_07490 [Paraclostridium bifermentans]